MLLELDGNLFALELAETLLVEHEYLGADQVALAMALTSVAVDSYFHEWFVMNGPC